MCAFSSGPAERDKLVLPFLAEGLRSGQKCIAVLDSVSVTDVLAGLSDGDVDPDRSLGTGQLEMATPTNALLPLRHVLH